MGTIEQKLNYLMDTKEAIRQAINAKGGALTTLDPFRSYADSILELKGGGGGNEAGPLENDVNFYDYDGTLLYAMTAEEALQLSELPQPPTHESLVFAAWNMDLSNIKDNVTISGKCDIGALYNTDDMSVRLYIKITSEARKKVPVCFAQSIAEGVQVHWGDGTMETSSTIGRITLEHEYATIGEYCITLVQVSNCYLTLGGGSSYSVLGNTSTSTSNNVYRNMLYKAEVSSLNITIRDYAFAYCQFLETVVLPNEITEIASYTFYHCYSLRAIVLPRSVMNCRNYSFQNCYALRKIVFNHGITQLYTTSVTMCYALKSVFLPNSFTTLSSNALQGCSALRTLVLSNNLTTISSGAISNGYSLTDVIIPNGISKIGDSMFSSCRSLPSIYIPPSVTTIQANAFKSCYALAKYDFSRHQSIPSLAATSAFSGIASDCKIVVPDALYDDWIIATNWSSNASYIIKASEYNG